MAIWGRGLPLGGPPRGGNRIPGAKIRAGGLLGPPTALLHRAATARYHALVCTIAVPGAVSAVLGPGGGLLWPSEARGLYGLCIYEGYALNVRNSGPLIMVFNTAIAPHAAGDASSFGKS